MIGAPELMALKQRMLLGAEAAHRIASSSDQFVMYDQEQYQAVMTALLSLKTDVRRLLAEHDILRSMFADRLTSFFMEEISSGQANPTDVGTVPAPAAGGSGEAVRQDGEGTDLGVPQGRVPGKRTRGSKPRRNRKGDTQAAGVVGRGDSSGEVDRQQDD